MSGQFCDQAALDRRKFLGVAVATVALPAASLIPVGPAAAAVTGPERKADWAIDDQWQGYPRYSESIGYARPAPAVPPAVEPVDRMFVEF